MPRRVLLYFLGLVLAGMVSAPWAAAQHGDEMGGGFQNKLLEVKRTQLGPALGVDQRIVDQLLQIDRRYGPLRHQLVKESKAEFQRLQTVMNQPSPPEPEVKGILTSLKQKQREMINLKQRQDEEEMHILTPVQQARYILYQMSLVKEAKSIRAAPGGPAPMVPKTPREIPVVRPTQ